MCSLLLVISSPQNSGSNDITCILSHLHTWLKNIIRSQFSIHWQATTPVKSGLGHWMSNEMFSLCLVDSLSKRSPASWPFYYCARTFTSRGQEKKNQKKYVNSPAHYWSVENNHIKWWKLPTTHANVGTFTSSLYTSSLYSSSYWVLYTCISLNFISSLIFT